MAVALANQASFVDPMMAMRGPGALLIDPSLPPEERTNGCRSLHVVLLFTDV